VGPSAKINTGLFVHDDSEPEAPPEASRPRKQSLGSVMLAACKPWRRTGEALWESTKTILLGPCSLQAQEGGASLVIFDWDDTLFPTTCLLKQGMLMGPDSRERSEFLDLSAVASAAVAALQTAKRYGKVVIVTNAISGWVQEMIGRFLPSLEAELADVPVISAQSIYEPQGFADPASWKSLCFQRIALCLFDVWSNAHGFKDLVSIGDSWYDRAAAFQASQDIGIPCNVKSMKLMEQPSVEDVIRQLNQTREHFDWLMCHDGVLDLYLQPSGAVGHLNGADDGQPPSPPRSPWATQDAMEQQRTPAKAATRIDRVPDAWVNDEFPIPPRPFDVTCTWSSDDPTSIPPRPVDFAC